MKKQGFTLFELLVSISIIGVLMAIAIVSYSSAQKKARDTRRIQDLGTLQKAAEQYYSLNNSSYPTLGMWGAGQQWVVNGTTVLELVPVDPKNADPYLYKPSGWITDTTKYCFCATLEGSSGNSSDGNCTFVNGTGQYYCIKNQQ